MPLHVESLVTLRGIPNLECVVLPFGNTKDVMPLDANGSTISPFDHKYAHNILHINIFTVPPCPYRKYTHLLPLLIALVISSYIKICSLVIIGSNSSNKAFKVLS